LTINEQRKQRKIVKEFEMKALVLLCFSLVTGLTIRNSADLKTFDFRKWERGQKQVLLKELENDFLKDAFLRRYRYSPQEIKALLDNVYYDFRATKIKPFSYREKRRLYKRLFLHEQGYKKGKIYLETHRTALTKAEICYGIPPEFIVAILWLESRLGKATGNHQAVHAIYSLYIRRLLKHRRQSLAVREARLQLAYLLALSRQLGLDPREVRSSYAGALGIPQFMPYSYVHYSQDGDKDGVIDLFKNQADAIASVACFLKRHGWSNNHEKAILRYQNDVVYLETVKEYAQHIRKGG
jgi:membrane-bound lytic murein transglycosylase B